MAFFSIITPFYNTQEYLHTCLQSLINQSFFHIEIILINDGSTDGSTQIAREYAKKDSRILLIEQENQGQGRARNVGMNHASGEYVFFVDSDDYLELDFCHNLHQELKLKAVEIMILPYYTTTSTKSVKNSYFSKIFPKEMIFDHTIASLSTLRAYKKYLFITTMAHFVFQRHFLEQQKILFPEKILYEDVIFCTDAFLKASKITTGKICGYHYFQSPVSTMRGKKDTQRKIKIANHYYQLTQLLFLREQNTKNPLHLKILKLSVKTGIYFTLKALSAIGYHKDLIFNKEDLLKFGFIFPMHWNINLKYPRFYRIFLLPIVEFYAKIARVATFIYHKFLWLYFKFRVLLSRIKRLVLKIFQ